MRLVPHCNSLRSHLCLHFQNLVGFLIRVAHYSTNTNDSVLISGTYADGVSSLYDLLQAASTATPVDGNQDGSYLTMKSNQGLVFGAATILSGFAGIFCDQGMFLFHD